MGKKKRYIHRASKFGKKAFNFLDKLDGTQDSQLKDTKLDSFITKVTLIDRGNQTYAIQVEASGPGEDPSNDALENDTVKYIIDGAAAHADNWLTFAAAAAGLQKNNRDEFITNLLAPAAADGTQNLVEGATPAGIVLTAGQHKIVAQIFKENKSAALSGTKQFSEVVDIAPAKVDISAITAAKGAGVGVNGAAVGEIALAAATAIELGAANTDGVAGEAAGRAAGESTFALGTGAAANDLVITMKTKQDADVTFTGDEPGDESVYALSNANKTITTTTAADPKDTVIRINPPGGGFSALEADNPHVMTVTPRTKAGALLTADAITISIDLS